MLLPRFFPKVGLPWRKKGASNGDPAKSTVYPVPASPPGSTPAAKPAQAPATVATPLPTASGTQSGSPNSPGEPAKPSADQTKLVEAIEKKLGPVTEELNSVKTEVGSFKKDLDSMKDTLKEMTSTFETSLVELKSFQAEMVNPINFMRKYFETMDIKTLSDPVMPFRPAEAAPQPATPPAMPAPAPPAAYIEKPVQLTPRSDNVWQEPGRPAAPQSVPAHETAPEPASVEEISPRIVAHAPTAEPRGYYGRPQEFLRNSLEQGVTPGKIMSVVAIVDEVLATMGPAGVDLILEQYKNMGLKVEEQRLVYGVVKMLKESKMQADEIIGMLYRFGQVLGLNDAEAELQFNRLTSSRRSRKTIPHSRGKVRDTVT